MKLELKNSSSIGATTILTWGGKPQATSATAPSTLKPTRADFQRGEKVSFSDRHLQAHVGIITRCNPKTASVDTGDGNSWSVPYRALRHVLDV